MKRTPVRRTENIDKRRVVELFMSGLTSYQIALKMERSVDSIQGCISYLRKKGVKLPYRHRIDVEDLNRYIRQNLPAPRAQQRPN